MHGRRERLHLYIQAEDNKSVQPGAKNSKHLTASYIKAVTVPQETYERIVLIWDRLR